MVHCGDVRYFPVTDSTDSDTSDGSEKMISARV